MKPVLSFACSRYQGWILGEAKEAVVSGRRKRRSLVNHSGARLYFFKIKKKYVPKGGL